MKSSSHYQFACHLFLAGTQKLRPWPGSRGQKSWGWAWSSRLPLSLCFSRDIGGLKPGLSLDSCQQADEPEKTEIPGALFLSTSDVSLGPIRAGEKITFRAKERKARMGRSECDRWHARVSSVKHTPSRDGCRILRWAFPGAHPRAASCGQ